MSEFDIKDSGARATWSGGMQRDTDEGKIDYTLVRDGVMYERWAEHLRKGALKYEPRNWLKGLGDPEVEERFKQSAARHFEQWLRGDRDEDHAAAVVFNMNGYETSIDGKTPIKRAFDKAEQEFRNGVGAGVYGEGDVLPDPTDDR
jgi:hypothetical protein